MTERQFGILERIIRPVNYKGSNMSVSLFASAGGYFGFFVRHFRTNELILPVRVGYGFDLVAENRTRIMAAFPARLGNQNGDWINLFAECDVTDPALMPSTGGMLEGRPNQEVAIDALQLPGNRRAPFVVNANGTNYNDKSFDCIEISYRFPTNPEAIHGARAGGTSKGTGGGTSKGVSIGTDPVEPGEREITNLDYVEEAHSFGIIRIMDRAQLTALLVADGMIELDPSKDRHWSTNYLRDNGLGDRLNNFVLDPVN